MTLHGPVTYDERSFLIGGRRIWLHAGDLHYFRHPAAEWAAALRRLKAAGLNTVSTYVAWNFHEPLAGECDFTGDRDVGRFLDLAAELGLYVIARPGPYICSEWDGGGLPAWLLGKPGIRTRENDPVYVAAFRRWFDRVLPIIAPRQVSQGGSVVLVQNENEGHAGWNESTRTYIRIISECYRAAGIDVPITACHCHGRPPDGMVINGTTNREDQIIWPDLMMTYNWGPGAECIRRLREVQPDKPLMVAEYWSGPQVHWGKPMRDISPPPVYARSMLEFASLGAQITYYMFEGGTNFAYWAGRGIATSYESMYPVREGGILAERYYTYKPANHLLTQFGPELADSSEVVGGIGATVPEGSRLIARRTPAGHLLFVSDEGTRAALDLKTPEGVTLPLELPTIRCCVLPYRFRALDGLQVDHANVALLGRSASTRTLVLWGMAGSEARIQANGREHRLTIPARGAAQWELDGCRILVVSEATAERSWFLDDGRVVFGPDFAELDAAGELSARMESESGRTWLLDDAGLQAVASPAPRPRASLPALSAWQRLDCLEPTGDGAGWTSLPDGPKSHEELGRHYGYVWYRAEFDSDVDGFLPVFAPLRSTRLTVYTNGVYSGTMGEITRFVQFCGYRHPADAQAQEQVLAQVRKGRNRILLLSDNLGRWFNGHPDIQGLHGPVYLGSRRISLAAAELLPPTPLLEEAFPGVYEREFREPQPLPGVEQSIEVPPDTDAYLVLPSGLEHVAVSIDGRHVHSMPKAKYPFSAVRLPPDLAGRTVRVRLQCEASGDIAPCLEHVSVHLAARSRALRNWAWKAGGDWPPDLGQGGTAVSVSSDADAWDGLMPDQKSPVGGGAHPAYYCVEFPMPDGDAPVFLEIGQMHKGQIFMNGHNLGRFWQVGGLHTANGVQHRYYLPRPWMKAQNTLVIFEEYGLPPAGVSLQH